MNLPSRKKSSLFPILIIILVILILGLPAEVSADSSIENKSGVLQDQNKVIIYLFWGDGCPHCAVAKPFLERLDDSSDQIELQKFEVWYVEENQNLFVKMAEAHGFEPQYVPTIFVGDRYWQGYNDQIEAEIQAAVNGCLETGCPDAGAGIITDPKNQAG